ncbi:MAG TPA: hypothetical protein VFT39_07655 [Vicinamibacterales bacterium]|nr:hypothetical protein [Vicinamibacterales bacterium]
MKGNRAILTAIVVVVLIIAGWWLFRRTNRGPAIDLISTFESATKKPPQGVFQIVDLDLNGEKKHAIFTEAPTRMIWKLKVPDDGWIKASLGMKPETWDKEGDGVYFRIGVSDGRTFEDLLTLHVDPFHNKADRRWIPVFVDVSQYAGEEVEVIFNTNNSMPGKGDDRNNDLALIAEPQVFIR